MFGNADHSMKPDENRMKDKPLVIDNEKHFQMKLLLWKVEYMEELLKILEDKNSSGVLAILKLRQNIAQSQQMRYELLNGGE